MKTHIEYQVHSDTDGHVSDGEDLAHARQVAARLDEEFPDQSHMVVEVKEHY